MKSSKSMLAIERLFSTVAISEEMARNVRPGFVIKSTTRIGWSAPDSAA